jgi:acyl dehydratase
MEAVARDTPVEGMYFEDLRVGQRFLSSGRVVSREDLDRFTELSGDAAAIHTDPAYARALGFDGPLVHGPLGIAAAFGLLFDMHLFDSTAIAMRDLDWRFVAPILVGDEVRLELTITRCRRDAANQAGVVNRHFTLLNQDGATVQKGTSSFLVQARDAAASGNEIAADFCSVPWATQLAERLPRNPEFAEATGTFDGTIALQAGREQVDFRVYKGRILECGRRTPHGATFKLAASELTWVALARAPRNDFIARATRGEFAVSGSTYEYLRLTKALVGMWDCIRDLAAGALAE